MVKKLVSVFCICAYFGLAHAQIPQEIWKESEQIEKQIKKTSFPDRVYNIKDFGAKEGNNGEIFCHEAINLAILTCSQAGGGTDISSTRRISNRSYHTEKQCKSAFGRRRLSKNFLQRNIYILQPYSPAGKE